MSLHVAAVDLYDPVQAAIWLDLLDHYARDPMGGGEGLSDYAKLNLVHTIRHVPGFHGALAWLDGQAVGLIDDGNAPTALGRSATKHRLGRSAAAQRTKKSHRKTRQTTNWIAR
jgi:hypothetical protein